MNAFAPLLAALVTATALIASNWLQYSLRERESARVWFTQYFVFEGVDLLLADVTLMCHQLGLVMDRTSKPKEIQAIPNNAIVRVTELVGAPSLYSFFHSMHLVACGLISENLTGRHDSDMERMEELIQSVWKMNEPLSKLRLLLFEIKANNHSQIAQIRYDHNIRQAVQEINKVVAETNKVFMSERCMIQVLSKNSTLD